MALVNCPDCNHQMSDKAPACPSCGRPMNATVIEATSKRFKGEQVAGCLMFIFGLFISSFAALSEGIKNGFAAMSIVGIVLFLGARIGAWWHHG